VAQITVSLFPPCAFCTRTFKQYKDKSFVCLAVAVQQTPPAERIDLSLNGLGEKKLTFPKDGNVAEVYEVIVSALLALGEGYEILRTMEGSSK